MASAWKVQINPEASPQGPFQVRPLKADSTEKASELLQRNHDSYHIYIHNIGLHNHILHHVLALLALNGTADQLSSAFDQAIDSQRSTRFPDSDRIARFAGIDAFKSCLGNGRYYDDYFAYFQLQIAQFGVPATVNEFLFKGDARAEDMLRRFFSGFLHSPIHLGYAIEFDQPLIAAEALALTAIHDSEIGTVLSNAELVAEKSTSPKSTSLIELQRAIHANGNFERSMNYRHGVFQLRDGILPHAGEELLDLLSSWTVQPHEVDKKSVECLNSTIFWTSLAQRPEKQIRFDFFLMHSITAGTFWPVFNRVPWITPQAKCRLLEWKGRADLLLYCQTGAPRLWPEELDIYQPRFPSGWEEVFQRACVYQDDGHLAKFIRAVATASRLSAPFSHNQEFMLTTEQQFLTIAHMGTVTNPGVVAQCIDILPVLDSAEQFNKETADHETELICAKYGYPRIMSPEIQRVTARWPRHVGFEEAWFHVPARTTRGPAQL